MSNDTFENIEDLTENIKNNKKKYVCTMLLTV